MAKDIAKDNRILEKLQNSTDEIHKRLDVQYALMEKYFKKEQNKGSSTGPDLPGGNERENKLTGAIKYTIDVLEQSKKSFKSKRLELLRKQLIDVLADR